MTIIFLFVLIILSILCVKYFCENKNLKNKYSSIIDIDTEIEKHKLEDEERKNLLTQELDEITQKVNEQKQSYKDNYDIYNELLRRKNIVEEDLELLDVGLYKPHFNFDDSSVYKEAININYENQKQLIKDNQAVICTTEWTVEGSKTKGKQMTQRNIKLMLRAFNGECDAVIAKVKWNNVDKMEARIEKAFNDINKLGETVSTQIQNIYLKLKYEELYLTHEYEQKKQEEKEEQNRIKERMREEQKAQKEYENARIKAEKEEETFQKALKKAYEQLEQANAEERSKYEEQIAQLQQKLNEAEELKQRAISQAQITKSGYVYVISNIGSFGEDVYKIGMTRRLDPMERVNELGDASVPFKFDVHAMIFSEDAPSLETKLHETFRDQSVNLVNMKKEFFRVPLDEIERVVKENNADIEFTKIAEAKDYRETLAIINAKAKEKNTLNSSNDKQVSDLPLEL